jgi:hypothetical protein
MRSLARVLVAVLGIASFPAVLWAFFHLLPLVADLFVLRRAHAYSPAVFELEWARLDDRTPVAVGTVAGRRELMSLGDVLPRRPAGLNDLQDLMAGRERLDVLYDAGGTATGFEGRRLRVLPAVKDLRADRLRRVGRTLLTGYGPALGLVGLALVLSRLDGSKRLGCWLFPSLFFLGVQPVFALFVIATELLQ